jgi:vacuolar-type H+-ATPase subunit E/Vma4
MEELQSTEVLDREILEDARRKAQRILKTADEEAAASGKVWDDKTEKALLDLKTRYEERRELGRVEIMARLPLDKRRLRLERIDGLLHEAAAAYLTGLDRETLLGILAGDLAGAAGELSGGDNTVNGGGIALKVIYRYLSAPEVEGLLKRCLPQHTWTVQEGDAAYLHAGSFPGIVADSGAVRVSVSADAVMETLLAEKRAELAAALLGEGALDA